MPHWDWLWCAEIEKFPSAVMAVRHPQSVNLGDVTADDFMQRASSFGQIDVLAGGPPCQAFSVAGLRRSMDDDRGNLSLRFVKIAHAIRPRNLLVENVPGWLNTPDNAFGCFLGAILGCDDALHSPADVKWHRTGMASGPLGRLCWATLDAQYRGLAQRRLRVFVVVDFGNGADPCSVLFEPESVLGNPPSRRGTGKDVAGTIAKSLRGRSNASHREDSDTYVADTLEASAGRSRGAGTPTSILCADVAPTLDSHFGEKMGLENQHINGGGDCSLPSVAMCLNAGAMQRLDPTFETLIPTNRCDFDEAEPTIFKPSHFTRGKDGAPSDISPPLSADADKGDQDAVVLAPMFGIYNGNGACTGDEAIGTLCSGSPTGGGRPLPAIAFSSKDSGNDATEDMSPTLRSMSHADSHANGGGQVAIAQEEPIVLMERGREGGSNLETRQDGTSNAILTPNGGRGGLGVGAISHNWSVRRLTPVECARLQGFPDDFLDITYRGKEAADGPKYKALGNSWAVPVGRYIMERIERFMP